ncbi:MAG: hypothetical protein JRI36_12560 [Deltaproteobacteria bacterium]|nr:hypothetical protein [Deltaproteobacteria bacterium]
MIGEKLYSVVFGEKDDRGQQIRVKPTPYLLGLKPHEAINALQENVQAVAEQVESCSDLDLSVPENMAKVRDLVFELEIAQGYLAEVFKTWQARQQQAGG